MSRTNTFDGCVCRLIVANTDLCFVPPLVYAVMGSSRNLGVGPVATSSLLVASIVGGKVRASDDPRLYTQLVFVSALFTGAEDPDGFHVAVSNHRVHGWHGGRDRAAAAQGLPRHDALHHQEVSTFVSAFVVGAVALIAAAFAIPPATSGTPLPSARSVTAAIDGERRRRPARREIAGGEVGPAAAARTRKWRRSASTGREARRSVERGEKRARERGGEREDDDVATLTCGAHVGLTLTQLTRRIKPGSKPLN
uniref:SLC26A/SulP transporter domain-containing protein n=1 Tax=Oryza rufipogon TaxID=4529 RepID=A0A0E0PNY6_ORYRU